MSTVFLIGNGFDLNCGIKTSYQDAYDGYVKTESNSPLLECFKKEILEREIDTWGDFEVAMSKYATKLSNESDLLKCLRDFKLYLCQYLMNEQTKFYNQLTEGKDVTDRVCQEMNKSFSTLYRDITESITQKMIGRAAGNMSYIGAISFNYTSVFDRLYNMVSYSDSPDVVHIHGCLDLDISDIALGMDNETQLDLPYPVSNKTKRGFIKPLYNQEYNIQRVNDAYRMIKEANTICIYGMTLGASDISWRNLVIECIDKNPNLHVFLYKYDLANKKYAFADERMDDEEEEKYKLFAEWELNETPKYLNQIHIPCGRNIFNIGEILASTK